MANKEWRRQWQKLEVLLLCMSPVFDNDRISASMDPGLWHSPSSTIPGGFSDPIFCLESEL